MTASDCLIIGLLLDCSCRERYSQFENVMKRLLAVFFLVGAIGKGLGWIP